MKKFIFVALLSFGFVRMEAQEVYNSSGKPGYHKKTTKKKGYDPSKLILGAGFNLDFGGGYADVGVSPIVGYRFTKNLILGVGLGYQYVQTPDFNFSTYNNTYYDKYNIIYPFLWARYFVWRGLYVSGAFEYDVTWRNYPAIDYNTGDQITLNDHVNSECLLLGAGFKQPIAGRASAFVELMYDVLQQEYSPYYGQPVIRAGVCFGF